MGRDYYIVVISDNLQHENHHKHCISLDHEPDYDDKNKIENNLYQEAYKDCKHLEDLDEKHKDDFCQLCRWYLEPAAYENEYVVLDYHQIRLPSFRGDYFMEEFICTDGIAYEYNREGGGVYWISMDNIESMEENITQVPEPRRTSDEEQFEQTKKTLQFLKQWEKKDAIKILYFTEY
jgi:hypothetical protein